MAYRFAINSSDVGVQYNLFGNDVFKVPVNVSVISEDDNAVYGSGFGIDVSVFGYVGAAFSALRLSTAGTTTNTLSTVKIGANGILDGGSFGINEFGNGDKIINYGQIYGATGVEFSSSAQAASGILYNYGTIEGGLAIQSLATALKIYNYGRINGIEAAAINTGFGDDLLYSRGQIDGLIQLGDGNDRLLNRGVINGDVDLGNGNDLLDNRGGLIEGTIKLRDGNDSFIPGAAAETVDGGAGENTIDFSHSSGVRFSLDGSIDATGVAADDTYTAFQDLAGSVHGNDVLTGDSGENVIAGFGGNDVLSGQAGNDLLVGGRGNDILSGGTDDDTLNGGDGNDTLNGGDGYDTLNGGDGNDTLLGGEGYDTLNGGAGADSLSGGNGDDTLASGDGDDKLYGDAGIDSLDGGAGNDRLEGGAGDDILVGAQGDDRLTGGEGIDQLLGGAGADTFVFLQADIAGTSEAMGSFDMIFDFSHAEADQIDLKAVDADTVHINNQAFKFIGNAAFSNVVGQLRYEASGSDVFVLGDTNGDGVADFAIKVANVAALVAADFVL